MAKVFLDPGHNFSGADTGAVGNGLREQDISWLIAARVQKYLEAAGVETKMSRVKRTSNCANGTVGASLADRCSKANVWRADLFVSIHCNAGGGTGTETYAYVYGSEGYKLAEQIQGSIVAGMGLSDRGVKIKPLYVLAHTNMPAVLVETAFIDNGRDASILGSTEGQEGVARGIANGILKHIGAAAPESEGLTMTQYEELKQMTENLTETVKLLAVDVADLQHPMIYNYIDPNMPEWARPTIKKLCDKGILKGDGDGLHLDDSMLRMLVINDRAGLYD